MASLTQHLNTFLLVLLVLMAATIIAVLATWTNAGPLDPPAPPASTMRTIDELLPAWSKRIPNDATCSSARFTCVLPTAQVPAGEAVLDHETGLVWERTPAELSVSLATSWYDAMNLCQHLYKGGRKGWRLPAADELASLLDADAAGPFVLGSTAPLFWTASVVGTLPGYHASVDFSGPGYTFFDQNGQQRRYWCVRGGAARAL